MVLDEIDDTPWESGLIEDGEAAGAAQSPLAQRVAQLEMTVMALVDLLAERGHVGRTEIPARMAQIRDKTRQAAEKAKAAEAERAQQLRNVSVNCVGCGVSLPKSDSFYSSRGVVCASCHTDDG
jgi:hypothetical protein